VRLAPHHSGDSDAGAADRPRNGCSFGVARRPNCAYNLIVRITYDAAKNERNIRRRGLSFDRATDFEFESARIHIDKRKDYGET